MYENRALDQGQSLYVNDDAEVIIIYFNFQIEYINEFLGDLWREGSNQMPRVLKMHGWQIQVWLVNEIQQENDRARIGEWASVGICEQRGREIEIEIDR